jgi:membrane protein DedA with SNARE-associated domain
MQELTGLLAQHGLALVFVNVLLAQGGVPLPAVPLLVVAGALVSQGQIALAPLLLVSLAASLIGAAVLPYLGVKLVQRYLLIRFLRMVRIDAKELRELMAREPKPVVLDARSAVARKLDPRRLPGAVAVDIESPQAALVAVPPDRDVIVYCS